MRAGTSRDHKEGEQMSQQMSQEERALRATLRAYAAGEVDTQAGWEAVAPRLTSAGAGSATQVRRPGPLAGVSRGVLVAAAVVALVVALAGAGVGTAYWGGLFGGPKAQLIGDERLYTTIGQSQTIGGVTVTIDKVYADPSDTYIAFNFTMPDAMAKNYTSVIANKFTITDAAGNEARGSGYVCEPLWHDQIFYHDGVERCLMDLGPFQPAAEATTLTLKVEIGELWLFRAADHERDFLTGPWRFSFSLPFHQQSLGPGGPYAEPTTRTPDARPATKTP
jgi:Domain of unknown function (DUF4179)